MSRPHNPQSHFAARAQVRALLRRRLNGAKRTRAVHLNRASEIAEAIWRKYQKGIYRVHVKHLRWFLDVLVSARPKSEWWGYYATIRQIVFVLGRDEDWLPLLTGPWSLVEPSGPAERRPNPPAKLASEGTGKAETARRNPTRH